MNNSFTEKEVSFQSEVELQGTLTLPKGTEKVQALLIIPGTGTGNRDGNVKWPKIEMNLYRDLANFFTSLGFATLRYDKRGVGKSKGKFNRTGMWDLVNDAQSAVQYLKNLPGIDRERVFVLGHSEGATLSIALSAKENVAGLILLSGTYQPMEHSLREQRRQLFQELDALKGFKGFMIRLLGITKNNEQKTEELFTKVKQSTGDTMWYQMAKLNVKWMREHLEYQVQEDIKKITCPTIAITGSHDFQVNCEEVHLIQELNPDYVESYIIPNMNHILKEQEYKNSALKIIKEYKSQANQELHKDLLEVLKAWVQRVDE